MKKLKKILTTERYMKRLVTFCITFIVLFTIASMYLNYRLAIEISPTLTSCVYTFFGTELAAMAVIRVAEELRQKEFERE